MSEWTEYNLGEIAEVQTGPFGSQLKNEQYITGGTPVITVEHIRDFKVANFDYPSVTEEDRSRLTKYTLKEGDIVFTRVGSVDLSAYVGSSQNGWMFSSRMLRVRPFKEVDARFLSYFFQQQSFRDYILGIAVGATMPSINTEILKSVPVSYPSLKEQIAIRGILSSLDEKIDLLHGQNKTLEELAKTLFRQWFVEEVDDSDLGEEKLEDYISLDPREKIERNSPTRFFDMKCLSNNIMSISEGIYRIVSSASSFRNNDTLLAKITPCLENGKTGFVMHLDDNEVARGSTEFIVMRSKGFVSPYWIYCLARNDNFRELAIASMNGTSGRQRVQMDMLKNAQVTVNKPRMNEFHTTVSPFFEKIKSNSNQIRTLTQLRDTLLPKLMSGEVKVKM